MSPVSEYRSHLPRSVLYLNDTYVEAGRTPDRRAGGYVMVPAICLAVH